MRASLPRLPVSDVLPALSRALGDHGAAVLVAPPGAGKTTLVPLHLLGDITEGRIILVEPRRLAARAAATRMADLLGEAPGATVGWRMRLDTRVSASTRIEVVTEGVATRMILSDPELSGVAAILFDEFHERSLDGDFALALALDVREALRPDLKLLVMSATLDGARVATLLGDAPVIESEGRAFPVTIRHRDRAPSEAVEDAVAAAIREELGAGSGSILAFLPGQREIERTLERLEGRVPADVVLAPLYGRLEGAAQDLAIRPAPAGRRKVVLATTIAETSITIDGVTTVVDSGLKRAPVFEPATGLQRLETVRVSRASADQRAGRAGRTAPGEAIRLWRAEQTAALEAFDRPEILVSDLSALVLDALAFGVSDPASLRFLDPPPGPAVAEARALLRDLGALDETGRMTATGEAMRALPLAPRLARMVAGAAPGEPRRTAARLAVLLTEPGLGGASVDLAERLRLWRADRSPRARAADGLAGRIAGMAPSDLGDRLDDDDPGALLSLAYPDRVALARGAPGSFLLSNGRGGTLEKEHALSREAALVVADLQGVSTGSAQRTGRIRSAAAIDKARLDALLAARIVEEDTLQFDPASRSVRARRVRRLGRAVLAEAPLPTPAGEETGRALMAGLRDIGLARLPWGKDGERLLARLRFLHPAYGAEAGWPAFTDEALLADLEGWLLPFVPGVSALSQIGEGALREALLARLPPGEARRLDDLAPSHFTAPTGSHLPIRYEAEGPVLAVRVQELFGLSRHPAIAGGRLPLILELLSPAHRPIQITRDLPGFWTGSWADVRADLRGRYPRHPWPEDPVAAPATNRAKPRG
ncbi:ATP-dependent helicase HrpB [Aureimonas sp. Leaf324]|uniref:ATP-dependent helicase HrpB n=1 Tax=Aureimonas sp. Leaf324 TaxID=1736336 RepID=UPI0006FC5E4B|nr:ATP-dependent helicase HrpB [Aureimonas sp. Leaf324]KQQ80680.1 ATP-dependent helicase [Aureimonas sp. Leaf324]